MGTFRFKYFSVCDDRATMKVGTDAVLLGAWANVYSAKTLLDVGSGSGIIALMMAQRTNGDSKIDAVELQRDDVQQCAENVKRSSWSNKISVHQSAIQDFVSKTKYHCILCNPPYFSNSLLPRSASRRTVRHDSNLTYNELLEASVRLLSVDGRLNVILPFTESERFVSSASDLKLFLSRHTRFFTRPGKSQERSLFEFRLTKQNLHQDILVLYQKGDQWTEAYRKLTEDFYLDQ